MKLRERLIWGYTFLAIFASLFIGTFYYRYLNNKYETTLYNNVQISSINIRNTLEEELERMEQVTLLLLSDMEVLQTIRDLSVKMEPPIENVAVVNSGKSVVKNALYTAYNLDNFYRVLVFNKFGYIGASATMQEHVVDTKAEVQNFRWLESVLHTKGKAVLIGKHPDDWATDRNRADVFSLVREIQGKNLGFVEVQQLWSDFEKIFETPDENIEMVALKPDGSVLYVSDGINADDYNQYFDLNDKTFDDVNEKNGEKELICVNTDENFGIKLIMVENWKEAMSEVPSIMKPLSLIVGSFFILSLCFIVLIAYAQTRPLQELRNKMENTQLSNLTEEIEIRNSDADIQALLVAYQDLMRRLEISIEKEKKLNILQLQAQFDTLQAQINPHFLYNVLNVVSRRGMMNDDETICEICGHLASMLRYSTNTKVRYATIREELDYMEQYFYLIQARYEDRVSLEIQVDDSIYGEIIPKTVVQQIVENCVNHGFANSENKMKVWIRGYVKDDCWYLEVWDNGQGFEPDVLNTLQEKMERTRRRLFRERSNIELEIGGMGLVNTYARMLLIYNDSLTFELKNTDDGAVVRIGAKKQKEEI